MPGGSGPGRQTDFPLRLLVQSDMVGAIIGRQGSTIRQITQQSRARVDVHRKDNVGSLEKAITIYGNPENCTNACKRILEVMQQEAVNTNKGLVYSMKTKNKNLNMCASAAATTAATTTTTTTTAAARLQWVPLHKETIGLIEMKLLFAERKSS